ncbi:MAG: sel1 repeat family protein [Ectothiorhodospiraceae bacterium]|nr:sel1 repeat family protein [Ectothiorhodospiraceae bacterium]
MRQRTTLLPRSLLLALAVVAAGARADFQAGVDAYNAKDYATALREFRALADKGVIIAYTNLGYMHALGEGVDADMAQAARWFLKAAEGGSAAAQVTVGSLYFHGEGVERNLPLAYAWFNVAATNGRNDALDYMNLISPRLEPAQLAEADKLSRAIFDRFGDPTLEGLLEKAMAPKPATASAGG